MLDLNLMLNYFVDYYHLNDFDIESELLCYGIWTDENLTKDKLIDLET